MMPPDARLGILRSAGWIIIVVAVMFLVLFSAPVQADPTVRVVAQSLTVTVTAVGLLTLWQRHAVPSMLIWALPYLAVVVASSLASERMSASREAAALITLSVAAYPGVFAIWRDAKLRPRLEWLLVVLTAALAVGYLAECFAAWLIWWSALGTVVPILRPGGAALTLGSPNAVAMFLEILLPLATVISWQRWRNRLLTGGLVTAGATAIFLTGSRGAWVAVGLVLIVALVMASRRRLAHGRAALPRWGWVAALVIIGTLVVAAPAVAARIAIEDAGRIELWRAAVAIFADHPVLGSGPATWGFLRPMYPISADYLAVPYTPHDVPLHIAAETGVLGLVGGGLILIGLAFAFRRAWRTGPPGARSMTIASSLSMAIILLHFVFDSLLWIPGFVLMLYIVLAYVDREVELQWYGLGIERLGRVAWTAIVAIALASLLLTDLAMLRGSAGNAALDRHDWESALAEYDAASGIDPGNSQYALGRAISLSHLGRPREALSSLADVAKSEQLAVRWAEMAALELDNDRATAVALADRAMSEGTYDPTALINAAAVLEAAGDSSSVEAAAAAILVAPYVVNGRTPPRISAATWEAALDAAVRRARVTDPLLAADLSIRAGRLADAATFANEGPVGPERAMLQAYLDSLSGGTPEWGPLRAILTQAPTDGRVLDWYVRLARHVGSQVEEARGTNTAIVALGGGATASYEVETFDGSRTEVPARVYGYPDAMTSRIGPDRPYLAETLTIEPIKQAVTEP